MSTPEELDAAHDEAIAEASERREYAARYNREALIAGILVLVLWWFLWRAGR